MFLIKLLSLVIKMKKKARYCLKIPCLFINQYNCISISNAFCHFSTALYDENFRENIFIESTMIFTCDTRSYQSTFGVIHIYLFVVSVR